MPRAAGGGEAVDRGRTLGVVGTFVLDRIVGLPGRAPVEDLGGLAYALSAVAVCLPAGWRPLAVARVGSDAAPRVREWMASLGLDASGLVEVPEPNNRVELRYRETHRRTERLTGGVGAWSWPELAGRVAACDALLVNYISGHETTLETAERLRAGFSGLVYADLHSLFLGTEGDGTRVPRPLGDWRRWVACFDAVQMNRSELDLMRGAADADATVCEALDLGPTLVACTRGKEGAVCWWRRDDDGVEKRAIATRPVDDGDPTGCGDVWGATMCCRLLAGDDVPAAAEVASLLASAAASQSGVRGLPRRLARAAGRPTSERTTNRGEDS